MCHGSAKFLPVTLPLLQRVLHLSSSCRSILQSCMTNWNRSRFLHSIRNIARFWCPLVTLVESLSVNRNKVPVQSSPIPCHHNWILQSTSRERRSTQRIGSISTINHTRWTRSASIKGYVPGMPNSRKKVFPSCSMMLVAWSLSELNVRLSTFIHSFGSIAWRWTSHN